MPSLPHEALLLLFRNRPELAPELLRDALHVTLPTYSEVRLESSDLTDLAPAEAVAKWCRAPIELGSGASLVPLVIGPASVPVVDDLAVAERARPRRFDATSHRCDPTGLRACGAPGVR